LPYFDHNATTFLAPEVAETMASALREVYGNASSIHRPGQVARQHLEKARRSIAGFLGASAAEIVFTSGGTEANNLAILGIVRGLPGDRKHVVTTAIEHPSVLECVRQLAREGVEVSVVDMAAIGESLRDDTVLVSVMHANNETGTIQPLREIAKLIAERRRGGQAIYFHSDGVQAAGKIPVDVRELGVDLYSLSAHKLFAPKGVGALYVRKGTPLSGIQFGGRHERERRAGTENVPAAIAFARAVELCGSTEAHLRDEFEEELGKRLPWIEVNGLQNPRVPNTSSVLFRGISGEALVIALDLQSMAVSTGSACSSGSIEPSHVLLAMGRSREEARSSVRFSFGRYNTAEEIEALIDATARAAEKLRKEEKRLAG
jgi:cysteine desulfurase